jgi:hypothetical protein
MAAAFGGGPPSDYAGWYGFFLNLGEAERRRGALTASALAAVQSGGRLPRWLFDALADSPEEADVLEFRAEAKRRFEEAKATPGVIPL